MLKFIKPRLFILAKREIHRYDVWAVAIACFTPVPVKVFAVVAGAISLPYKKMIIIAFFSRGARFFLVSTLLYFFGEEIKKWILDYMDWVMIGTFVFMIFSALIWKGVQHFLIKKEHLDISPY